MTDIYTALAAVMADVQAVRKGERNNHGGYSFRGIDAVVNAVGPAFRQHRITVGSRIESYEFGEIETGKNRTPMGHARVVVAYEFHAPDGSSLVFTAPGEAFDSGDKATPKAMSVAYRTALLQALCLPTDEPDPDSQTFERSAPPQQADPPMRKGEIGPDQAKAFAWEAAGQHETDHEPRMAVLRHALGDIDPSAATVPQLLNAAAELNKTAPAKGAAA